MVDDHHGLDIQDIRRQGVWVCFTSASFRVLVQHITMFVCESLYVTK